MRRGGHDWLVRRKGDNAMRKYLTLTTIFHTTSSGKHAISQAILKGRGIFTGTKRGLVYTCHEGTITAALRTTYQAAVIVFSLGLC